MEAYMLKKVDNSQKYYISSPQLYKNSRLPGNKVEQQQNTALAKEEYRQVLTEQNITLPEKPMSEARFLGAINQIINKVPDSLRMIFENLKQKQLLFFQNKK